MFRVTLSEWFFECCVYKHNSQVSTILIILYAQNILLITRMCFSPCMHRKTCNSHSLQMFCHVFVKIKTMLFNFFIGLHIRNYELSSWSHGYVLLVTCFHVMNRSLSFWCMMSISIISSQMTEGQRKWLKFALFNRMEYFEFTLEWIYCLQKNTNH